MFIILWKGSLYAFLDINYNHQKQKYILITYMNFNMQQKIINTTMAIATYIQYF